MAVFAASITLHCPHKCSMIATIAETSIVVVKPSPVAHGLDELKCKFWHVLTILAVPECAACVV